MKTMTSMTKLFSLALVATMTVAGCAQQLDDIDQVQNNITLKSELRGEFYFRSTVVDAPYASMGFFVGNQNYHLERGYFEIQEKTLYFYRTYEHVIGGETLGSAPDVDTPVYELNDDGSFKLDSNGKNIPVMYERRIGDEILTVQRFVYKGSPIAAFPITGHFDVQRVYNPLTGEQTNVVTENTTDREWWERQYMRVQWGVTQVAHYDENILPKFRTVSFQSLGEFHDEEFDDAPVKVYNEDGTLDYMDYTLSATLEAPVAWYGRSGFDYIPACWYYPWYVGQVTECTSERITFRQAFMKVKPSTYVAWDYDDSLLKKFGYYRLERGTYEATRGVTFSGVSRRIRRHRIWEEYVVAKGDACDANGGNVYDACTDGKVCEVFEDGKFCVAADANDRLDYAQMTPKPIVWYLSEEFPRELVPESILIGKHWDPAFSDVVKTRKPDWAGDHEMFIVCENNLTEAGKAMQMHGLDINNADDVAKAQGQGILAAIDGFCEDMDSPKRNGDLRYSQLHSVNDPTSVGLYGYGPSSADPLTGELLSANSYMYTPAMKRGANRAMLAIELSTGIRDFWETVYANHVSESMSKNALGSATGGLPTYTVASAVATAKGLLAPKVSERLSHIGLQTEDANWAQNRMAMLAKKAPAMAASFITDDVKMLHRDPSLGLDTGESTEELVDRLGMHQWAHSRGDKEQRLKYNEHSAEAGCKFYEEFADNAILGIAREYAAEMNARVCASTAQVANTIYDFQEFEDVLGACDSEGATNNDGLLVCASVETASGATGLYWTNPCTVGKLKVQLANELVKYENMSEFNLNVGYYPPDPVYTDTQHEVIQNSQLAMMNAIEEVRAEMITRLWKRIYLGVAEHEVGHSIGLRHNFEASTDAMNFGTKYWNLKGQYDNDGNFNAYDMFAAETPHQANNHMRSLQSASVMDYSAKFNDRFEGVGYYDRAAVRFGYGGLVEVFNQDPATDKFAGYLEDPAETDPSNQPIVPDFASNDIETIFKRVHYTNIPELYSSVDDLYDRSYVPWSGVADGTDTVTGKKEVPFRFCSDELAGWLPTCERWDSGVDSYEITRNALADYEQYWPIWGHWHQSLLFFPDNYYSRIMRMFYAVKFQMQWWVADYQRFNRGDWWQDRFGVPWHQDPNGGLAGAIATADGMNTLVQTFGRPEPGNHGYRGSKNVFEPVPYLDNALYTNTMWITPTNCEARQMYPAWDYSGYLPVAVRAGAIYERLAAYQMLADPSTYFLANDYQSGGVEQYQISYYSLFPQETMNLFSGMLANATDKWGWYMVADEEGRPLNCARRVAVGPDAGLPEIAEGQTLLPFNPEGEYVFPTTRFRVPMLAAYYGLGLLLDGYDDSYTDVTRVFLDGHKAAITPTDDAILESFTDPLSGKTYTAVGSKTGAERGVFYPAIHMVKALRDEFDSYNSLQELQENYNYSEYQFVLDKLELLRGMNHAYDYAE